MNKWKAGPQPISPRVVRRQILRLLPIALFIALSVVGTPRVGAQVECLGVCEAQLASCVGGPRFGDLQLSASCLETYEACVDACLGSFNAILD